MIPERPRPILSASNAGAKIDLENRPVPIIADKPKSRLFVVGAIKQLFGEVKRFLIGKNLAPPPQSKRRRSGDTQGGFHLAAKRLLRRVRQSIYHPANFLWEPPTEMDESQRLDLWQQNNVEGEYFSGSEAFHNEAHDHLSLHL